MKNSFLPVSGSHKPSLREALEAIRAHSDARSGMTSSEEIKRLQQLTDQLYAVAIESYCRYQSQEQLELNIRQPNSDS